MTHPSLNTLPIYAAIGVSEAWRYIEQKVIIYQQEADSYAVVDVSRVLPGVTSRQLTQFVDTGDEMPRPTWLRSVRAWAESLLYEMDGETREA